MHKTLRWTRSRRPRALVALAGFALLVGSAGFAPRRPDALTGGSCGQRSHGPDLISCFDASSKAEVKALSPVPLLDPDPIVRQVTGLSSYRLKVVWTHKEVTRFKYTTVLSSVEFDYLDVAPPPPHDVGANAGPYLSIGEYLYGTGRGPDPAPGRYGAPVNDFSVWLVAPAGKLQVLIESDIGLDHGLAVVTAIGNAILNGTDPASVAAVVTPQAQGRPTPTPVVGTYTATTTGPADTLTAVATATDTPSPTVAAAPTATPTVAATPAVSSSVPLTPTTPLSITAGSPPTPTLALAAAFDPRGIVAVRLHTRPFAQVTLTLDVPAAARGSAPAPRLRTPWAMAARWRRAADRRGLLDARLTLPANLMRATTLRLGVQVRTGRGSVAGYALLRPRTRRR